MTLYLKSSDKSELIRQGKTFGKKFNYGNVLTNNSSYQSIERLEYDEHDTRHTMIDSFCETDDSIRMKNMWKVGDYLEANSVEKSFLKCTKREYDCYNIEEVLYKVPVVSANGTIEDNEFVTYCVKMRDYSQNKEHMTIRTKSCTQSNCMCSIKRYGRDRTRKFDRLSHKRSVRDMLRDM
jgi:hypothetical protein